MKNKTKLIIGILSLCIIIALIIYQNLKSVSFVVESNSINEQVEIYNLLSDSKQIGSLYIDIAKQMENSEIISDEYIIDLISKNKPLKYKIDYVDESDSQIHVIESDGYLLNIFYDKKNKRVFALDYKSKFKNDIDLQYSNYSKNNKEILLFKKCKNKKYRSLLEEKLKNNGIDMYYLE